MGVPTSGAGEQLVKRSLPGSRSQRGAGRVVPRGRHGRSRIEIEAIQRERILDAFVRVVGRFGFTGAHISAVCAEAGVSTREFYEIFGCKEDALFAAFDVGSELLCERGRAAYEESSGRWEDRVRAALAAMLSLLAENPAFARLCLVEMLVVGQPGVDRLNAMISHCCELFRADEDLVQPPEISEEECVNAVIGSVLRPVTVYVRQGKSEQLTDLVPGLTYSIALHVVGQERALRQLDGRCTT
jgi:AcrR family transcriptional regulator